MIKLRAIGEPEEVEKFMEDLKEFMELNYQSEPKDSRKSDSEVLVYSEVLV